MYFAQTLCLFIASDVKIFVIPQSSFEIMSALAEFFLATNHASNTQASMSRIPQVLLWTWLNTLVFDLANQRLLDSIKEDAINRSWRPLPAERIQASDARRWLFRSIVIVIVVSLYLKAAEETLLLMYLNWMYNDLDEFDESYILWSLFNSAAFACYGFEALRIASQDFVWNNMMYRWTAMIFAIIFTTMQVQDLKDQEGDKLRGRTTMPLVLGDKVARWSIVAPMMLWSFACPAFWSLDAREYIAPLVFEITVAVRMMVLRSKKADSLIWKIWAFWLMSLYCLPLVNSITVQR